jgi:hypothetical protein
MGDLDWTAPARTASSVKSLKILIAGTPYRSAKAGLRISFKDITPILTSLNA